MTLCEVDLTADLRTLSFVLGNPRSLQPKGRASAALSQVSLQTTLDNPKLFTVIGTASGKAFCCFIGLQHC